MTMPATNLFGEQRIKIDGNPLLEGIANHILDLIGRNPEVQGKEGDTVGTINHNVITAIWREEGLDQFIAPDKREAFLEWISNSRRCSDPEAISRARRHLCKLGLFRMPQSAIVSAERHRQRISRSVR